MFPHYFSRRRRNGARRATAVVLALAALFAVITPTNAVAQQTENLRSYYPNIDMVRDGNYLEGNNHISGSPQRSVLWFQERKGGRFRQYNWAPNDAQATCHWDQLRWRNGTLRYQTTRDRCTDVDRKIRYQPAIRLMPETWAPGSDWSRSGTSRVTYSENGDIVCLGSNAWTATVEGYVDLTPNVQAIHIVSRQSTTWTEGQSSTGCSAGFTTEWQEDYFLLPAVPLAGGGTAPAFKRSKGGNLAGGPDQWDVWFDSWQPLPQ
jgi:hypothetical protein